jgi:hypothetical protein
VQVAATGGGTLSVQQGSCGDGCFRLFVFLDDRFLGWDWPEPSTAPVTVAPGGASRFIATYANDSFLTPVTFTWNGNRLTPNGTPPGHCVNGC